MAIPAFAVRMITNWALKDLAKNGDKGTVAGILNKLKPQVGPQPNPGPQPGQQPGPLPQNFPTPKHGAQGWNDPENGYLPTRGERAFNTVFLPTLGDALGAAGNAVGIYHNAFAAALQAASKAGGYKSGAVPDPAALLPVAAAAQSAKGNIYAMIGNALAGRLHNIADSNKQENALARRAAMMENNGMTKTSAWAAMGSANKATVPSKPKA